MTNAQRRRGNKQAARMERDAQRYRLFNSRPPRLVPVRGAGDKCKKCGQRLVEKHHERGIYQVVCRNCGWAAGEPYEVPAQ